jgi:hypothetical protein
VGIIVNYSVELSPLSPLRPRYLKSTYPRSPLPLIPPPPLLLTAIITKLRGCCCVVLESLHSFSLELIVGCCVDCCCYCLVGDTDLVDPNHRIGNILRWERDPELLLRLVLDYHEISLHDLGIGNSFHGSQRGRCQIGNMEKSDAVSFHKLDTILQLPAAVAVVNNDLEHHRDYLLGRPHQIG